jgi:glycerol-3-phosphate O-acyltransferase
VHFPALDEAGRKAEVARIAHTLMDAIGAVVPVLPVSLVASLLLAEPARAWSLLDLKAAAHARMAALAERGARLYLPRQDHDYAIEVGLRMLTLRKVVGQGDDGLYRISPGQSELVAYYAHAIAHLEGGSAGGPPILPADTPPLAAKAATEARTLPAAG